MSENQTPNLAVSRAPARPRKNSAQYLDNQKFAYLLDDAKSPDDGTLTPVTPLSPLSMKITPSLRNGANASGAKGRFNKPRTSSIQIETTKTNHEQLAAIHKEVEFLIAEVPHFAEIYSTTSAQWAHTKRKNKAESEAFSLIQTLTEWIHSHGNKAVKEYDEFKASAEAEILSMVGKMEKMNNENTKLNLVYSEAENEKEEALNALATAQVKIAKYASAQEELNEDQQHKEVTTNTIHDLENELHDVTQNHKALQEKYERVENYWKMTQAENDELRNKNYAMDEETTKLKVELKQNRENLNSMNIKHEKVVKNLQIEHQSYAHQMRQEQEKLIAAQHTMGDQSTDMGLGVGYTIDADDADIQGSGITDDGDDYDGMGGIVSMEDEINVYQYEDDEWLDDSESLGDYDDLEEAGDNAPIIFEEPEPEPEPAPVEEEEEEYNKQIEFESETLHDYHDINYDEISKGYKTSKLPHDERNDFLNESMKISVESKKNGLDLMMSSTIMSHTPQMSSPMGAFEASHCQMGVLSIKDQFEAQSSGVMSKRNDLIDRSAAAKPVTLTKRIIIERGPKKEEKPIVPGKNFAERLAMFKHLDETRGGKPQILEQSKAYALVKYWNSENRNSTLKNIAMDKNIHITKSTIPHASDSKTRGQNINVLKITKKKAHTLKPRLFGFMNIIRSSFIPRWKATQKPRYFFVLDGLPSETNINAKEPDFAKNRQHDFLVPTLFFFESKDDYDTFSAKVANIAVRDIQFQKLFAQYAKGIFPLNKYAMEISIVNCMKRVNKLNKRSDIKLSMEEINACGPINDAECTILLCNEKELHRATCNDKHSRNKWVKKVNRLVDKRAARLVNINDGLMNVYDEHGNRKLAPSDIDTAGMDTPVSTTPNNLLIGSASPSPYGKVDHSNIITRKSRASVLRQKKIKTVEAEFD
eukprot:88438_1